jgi:hypothetical protein
MGSTAGQPMMQIVGDFDVTNMTTYPIVLSAVKMKKPKYYGHVTVWHESNNQIPPGALRKIRFHFHLSPPFLKQGEPLEADIAVLDQFGNEHWIRNVHFRYV